jgi:hypothetical protein
MKFIKFFPEYGRASGCGGFTPKPKSKEEKEKTKKAKEKKVVVKKILVDDSWDAAKGYLLYEKARKKLCAVNRHCIETLELLGTMDEFTWALLEAYENLDPKGEK